MSSLPNWKKIHAEFDKLSPLPTKERSQKLRELEKTDPLVHSEVRLLLHVYDHGDSAALVPMRENDDTPVEMPPTLGPYQLLEQLGEGGMGVVYRAKKEGIRGFEKFVAIKVMNPDAPDDPAIGQFLENEAKILSNLNHPNVIHVFEYLYQEGHYYLVSELLEGKTLLELAVSRNEEERFLDLPDVLFILEELLEALSYLHGKSLVHADIKPENVMVTTSGTPKLIDFGIANSKGRWGTNGYIAPEVMSRKSVPTPSSDIFALFVTTRQLLGKQTVPDWLDYVLKRRYDSADEALQEIKSHNPMVGSRESLARLIGPRVITPSTSKPANVIPFRRSSEKRRQGMSSIELETPKEVEPIAEPLVAERPKRRRTFPWKQLLVAGISIGLTSIGILYMRKTEETITVVSGPAYVVGHAETYCLFDVKSTTEGAEVSINSHEMMVAAPARFFLPCGQYHWVRVEKPGFIPAYRVLRAAPKSEASELTFDLTPGRADFARRLRLLFHAIIEII